MKKIRLWLTTIAVLLCSITASAYDFEAGGIYYNITSEEDMTVEVTYTDWSYYDYIGDMVIPSSVTDDYGQTFSVTSIGQWAFEACRDLTSITIPESITSIGFEAFNECTGLNAVYISSLEAWCKIDFNLYLSNPVWYSRNLYLNGELITELVIPNTITKLKANAFYGCSSFTSVVIPESLDSIDFEALGDCDGLTSIVIPENVTYIGRSAFRHCSNLTSFTLPENLTYLAGTAFELTPWYNNQPDGEIYVNDWFYGYKGEMPEGTSIDIAEGTVGICGYALDSCYNLVSVTIPDNVKIIGEYAFLDCVNLSSVSLPKGLKTIEMCTFLHCSNLSSISIPEGLNTIGAYAFQGCHSLVSITIPESVNVIQQYAFSIMNSLASIVIPNGVTTLEEGTLWDCPNLTSVTLPENLELIGYAAFDACSNLSSITLPDSVCYIASFAFAECSNLTSINIPESVYYIGSYAFHNCSSLTSISLPEGMQVIERYLFNGCTSLKQVTLPSTISIIGRKAFYNSCSELTSLATVPPQVERDYDEYWEEYYDPNLGSVQTVNVPVSAMSSYKSTSPWSSLTILPILGDPIEIHVATPGTMGQEILKHTDYLRNVNNLKITGVLGVKDLENIRLSMPDLIRIDLSGVSLTEIPQRLFSGKKSLRTVILPNNLDSIGVDAFYNCSMLSEIAIPEGCTSIGAGAFEYCSSLASITIPEGVRQIGNYAFGHCTSLYSVSLPKSLEILGSSCFDVCNKIEEIMLPSRLKTIPSSAFSGCSSLRKVTLPEGIEYIGYYAFSSCRQLQEIVFPKGLKAIGGYAFYYCTSLTSITIPEGCTYVSSAAFNNCNSLKEATLPSSLIEYNGLGTSLDKLTCMALIPPVTSGSPSVSVLYVPALAVNNYKQTPGWASVPEILPIEDTYPQSVYVVNEQLLNYASEDIPAEYHPDMYIGCFANADETYYYGSLSMKGTATWALNRFNMMHQVDEYWDYDDNLHEAIASSLINEAEMNADTVMVEVYVDENEWQFLSFPYDVKVSDILTKGGDWVVRRYDGKARAKGDYDDAWATVPYDGVLQAGQGYIWSGTDGYFGVVAVDNENKNRIFARDTQYAALEANSADRATDAHWNLVGNPFPSYYDTRYMEYSAPITVWDRENYTYAAYSPVDDSYVLRPFEAFFVQKPAEVEAIAFAPEGRQADYTPRTVETKAKTRSTKRQVINLTLSNTQYADRTRLVLNEEALKEYEATCDAPKFMSNRTDAPQLFTLEEGEKLSINERPLSNGHVALGIYIGEQGIHTMTMEGAVAQKVVLVDHATGVKTDLTLSDYTFTGKAGYYADRFSLVIGETTDINAAHGDKVTVSANGHAITVEASADVDVEVYNTAGAKVGVAHGKASTFEVTPGVYIVKVDGDLHKVSVK